MFTVGDIIYDAQGNPVGRTSGPGGGQQTGAAPQSQAARRPHLSISRRTSCPWTSRP